MFMILKPNNWGGESTSFKIEKCLPKFMKKIEMDGGWETHSFEPVLDSAQKSLSPLMLLI